MSTVHKSFAAGEILTAYDINNALNPGIADHIPYAFTVLTWSLNLSASSVGTVEVALPSGRFGSPPAYFPVITYPGTMKLIAQGLAGSTKDKVVIQVRTADGANATAGVGGYVLAVMMRAGSVIG